MAVHFCPTCRSAFESPEPRCARCGQVVGDDQQWTPPWAMETSMDMEAPSNVPAGAPTAESEPQLPTGQPGPIPMAAHDQKTLLEGHAPATPKSGPDQTTLLEARASKLMAQVEVDESTGSEPGPRGAEQATLLEGHAPQVPASPPPQQHPQATELVRVPTHGGRWVVVAGLVAAVVGLALLALTLFY